MLEERSDGVSGDDGDELTRLKVENENLRRAIDSRDLIGQAKGMLMARGGLSADDAFRMLVIQSQRHNMKVVEIAQAMVEKHQRSIVRASTGSQPQGRGT